MIEITSLQNQRVKRLLNLQQKSKLRKETGLFVIEGLREIERALVSGYQAEELWVSDENIPLKKHLWRDTQVVKCSKPVFEKLTYRENNAGLVGVFRSKLHRLDALKPIENPIYVVVEGVEKPGNLGAILRTCNGLGADALFVCDSSVDIYNPNVVRNSLGALFNTPIVQSTTKEAITYFKANNIQIVCAYLPGSITYTQVDYKKPTALVLGAEDIGLTDEWVKNTNAKCVIPMHGVVDSLNVSVATAIFLAEAIRQRI